MKLRLKQFFAKKKKKNKRPDICLILYLKDVITQAVTRRKKDKLTLLRERILKSRIEQNK